MKISKKRLVSIIAIILCAVLIIGLVSYDYVIRNNQIKKTYIAMGTVITTSVIDKDAQLITDEIEEAVNGIENSCLSWMIKDSDVWRINENAGEPVSVSRDVSNWISRCIDISVESDGAFDITIGKISQLWNIGSGNEEVPSQDEIDELLKKVGYNHILLSDTTVEIDNGQAIDLGAVGKGIACDVIRDILNNYGTKEAVISVGGSLLIYGNKAAVGIVDPDDDSKHIATIEIKDKCVSTSGDYERFFEKDGVKYHHIIDPADGYPANTDLRSVTVVCQSGLDSDALSTACFVLGYRKSLELLEKYDAEAVFVFNDNTINVTDGLADDFKLNSNNYTVEQ